MAVPQQEPFCFLHYHGNNASILGFAKMMFCGLNPFEEIFEEVEVVPIGQTLMLLDIFFGPPGYRDLSTQVYMGHDFKPEMMSLFNYPGDLILTGKKICKLGYDSLREYRKHNTIEGRFLVKGRTTSGKNADNMFELVLCELARQKREEQVEVIRPEVRTCYFLFLHYFFVSTVPLIYFYFVCSLVIPT